MKKTIRYYLYIVCGILSVILGIIGILLPLLPTTPFLLLAIICFTRSSETLKQWLLHHPILGKYIYNYTVHKAIPKRTKIQAITLLWVTMTLSMVYIDKMSVTIILTLIGAGVTYHLLSLKTLLPEES